MKIKINEKLFASIILLWVLSSCTNTNISKQETLNTDNIIFSKQNIDKAKNEINKSDNQNKQIVISDDNDNKDLTINEKCIWCSKCVRVAPTNFAMDYSTHKAIIISQENNWSDRVNTAIQICPVDAIELW